MCMGVDVKGSRDSVLNITGKGESEHDSSNYWKKTKAHEMVLARPNAHHGYKTGGQGKNSRPRQNADGNFWHCHRSTEIYAKAHV